MIFNYQKSLASCLECNLASNLLTELIKSSFKLFVNHSSSFFLVLIKRHFLISCRSVIGACQLAVLFILFALARDWSEHLASGERLVSDCVYNEYLGSSANSTEVRSLACVYCLVLA